MNQMEKACLYFLHSLPGVGNKALWKIKLEMGSFQKFVEGDGKSWQGSSLSAPIKNVIAEARRKADPLAMLDKLHGDDIRICCVEDKDYPEHLRSIFDPPYLFYYRGDLQTVQGICIGVVGSRAATSYGKIQARRFGNELAGHGITVTSGMARGIDSQAHWGALEAGGKTAAVLGSGIKVIYPPENHKLYDQICEHGLVLSEFSPHTHPEPGNFPARNRTIAGLSRGVLVVEAKRRSGALITADFALEQGRDVFAIPGPINSKNSEGTNHLIKQGAGLVSNIDDILDEYGLETKITDLQQGELVFECNSSEARILEAISNASVHFDNLLALTALDIGELNMVLLKLELEGIIKALPGNYYVKI